MRPESALDQLVSIEGRRRTITLVRTDLARAGEDSFTTFSPEALMATASHMQAWTVSRLVRAAIEIDSLPRVMEVGAAIWTSTDATPIPESVRDEKGPDARLAVQLHREWPHEWYTPGIEPFARENLEALREEMHQWLLKNLEAAGSSGTCVQSICVVVDACRG